MSAGIPSEVSLRNILRATCPQCPRASGLLDSIHPMTSRLTTRQTLRREGYYGLGTSVEFDVES